MRPRAGDRWSERPRPVAVALPYPEAPGVMAMIAMREKFENLRDTLMVVSMQISFRVVMWMRHLNY
jgi:hypothetical protein